MKKVLLIVAALALLGGAFYGGVLYSGASDSSVVPGEFAAQGGRGAMGGAFGDMTEEERAQFQSMTDEERQAYLEEQGIDLADRPTGAMGGPSRGGLLEGEVVEVAEDVITIALPDGGSQSIYIDSDTVVAYAEGAAELTAGSEVLLFSESEADGVTTAQAIVVR